MKDIYEDIFLALSKKLPKEEDVTLLKTLLEVQREGGGDGFKKKLKTLIQAIVGE
jgi:hypothetical protein